MTTEKTRSVFAKIMVVGGDEPEILLTSEWDDVIKLPLQKEEDAIMYAQHLYQWIRLVGKIVEEVESDKPGVVGYKVDFSGRHCHYHPKFQYLFERFKGDLLLLFRGLCESDDKIFEDKLEFHAKACIEFIKQWEEDNKKNVETTEEEQPF